MIKKKYWYLLNYPTKQSFMHPYSGISVIYIIREGLNKCVQHTVPQPPHIKVIFDSVRSGKGKEKLVPVDHGSCGKNMSKYWLKMTKNMGGSPPVYTVFF